MLLEKEISACRAWELTHRLFVRRTLNFIPFQISLSPWCTKNSVLTKGHEWTYFFSLSNEEKLTGSSFHFQKRTCVQKKVISVFCLLILSAYLYESQSDLKCVTMRLQICLRNKVNNELVLELDRNYMSLYAHFDSCIFTDLLPASKNL